MITTDEAQAVIYGYSQIGGGIRLGSAITTLNIDSDNQVEIACGAASANVPPDRVNAGMAFIIYSPDLLRNYEIEIIPNDLWMLPFIFSTGSLDPIDDLYEENIYNGFDDVEDIVIDDSRQLVFYEVTIPCNVLHMAKSPDNRDTVRIYF